MCAYSISEKEKFNDMKVKKDLIHSIKQLIPYRVLL